MATKEEVISIEGDDVSSVVSTDEVATKFEPIIRKRRRVECTKCFKDIRSDDLKRHMQRKDHSGMTSTSYKKISKKGRIEKICDLGKYEISSNAVDAYITLEVLGQCTFKKWITGYHVYRDIWTPEIGEILSCEVDPTNPFDCYAVSVISDGETVGHVPRTVSKTITNILLADGKVEVTVIAKPKRTRRNGIMVPCKYILEGPQSFIEHAKTDICNSL